MTEDITMDIAQPRSNIESYVENTDSRVDAIMQKDFNELLSGVFMNNKAIVEEIDANIGKRIGTDSAVGQVYTLTGEYENYILKVTDHFVKNRSVFSEEAIDFYQSGHSIHRIIPNTFTDQSQLLTANDFTETIIGTFLPTKLQANTPCFMKIFGSMIKWESTTKFKLYTLMEKLTPYNMVTPYDFNSYMFLLTHALVTSQSKYGFVHHDLHADNVMGRKIDGGGVSLVMNSDAINIQADKVPVIIDYGFSRIENKHVILVPKLQDIMSRPTDLYEFIPFLDILDHLFSMYTNGMHFIIEAYMQIIFPKSASVPEIMSELTYVNGDWRLHIQEMYRLDKIYSLFGEAPFPTMVQIMTRHLKYMKRVFPNRVTVTKTPTHPASYISELGSYRLTYRPHVHFRYDTKVIDNFTISHVKFTDFKKVSFYNFDLTSELNKTC